MPAVSTLAIIGLAVSAVGTFVQMDAAKDAQDAQEQQAAAQREQAMLENRRADISNARQLRNAIRQARIARATILNTGANVGTMSSSGVLGGTASIDSQRNSNVGFFGAMDQLNDKVTNTQMAQADAQVQMGEAQGQAAVGGALGTIGGGIFSGAGGFKTIFS